MNKQNQINLLQVIFLFMSNVGIISHVIILPAVLGVTRRDSWVAVLVGGSLFLLLIIGFAFIMKQTKQENIYCWLKNNSHPFIAWLVVIPFAIDLLMNIFVSYYDTIRWTNTAYLPNTPFWITSFITICICVTAAYLGLETIAITNGILIPFVILFGLFVMSGNFPQKNYSLLFPIFQHGLGPILKGAFYAESSWMQLVAIFFLQHHLKSQMKLRYLWFLGLFLIMITLGPIMGAITEFGPELSGQLRYPAYEQWRLLTLGQLVEHVDFLSIYQWWAGSFIRISLQLYFITEILRIQKKATRLWILILLAILYFGITQLPISDIQFWSLTSGFVLPISLYLMSFIFFTLLIICIWNYFITKQRSKSHVQTSSEGQK